MALRGIGAGLCRQWFGGCFSRSLPFLPCNGWIDLIEPLPVRFCVLTPLVLPPDPGYQRFHQLWPDPVRRESVRACYLGERLILIMSIQFLVTAQQNRLDVLRVES